AGDPSLKNATGRSVRFRAETWITGPCPGGAGDCDSVSERIGGAEGAHCWKGEGRICPPRASRLRASQAEPVSVSARFSPCRVAAFHASQFLVGSDLDDNASTIAEMAFVSPSLTSFSAAATRTSGL